MRGIGGRSLSEDEKRTMLLDSAERTFGRLGYARTTISALADEAGVTRPTVYAYYDSKDDVFRALAERVRDESLALQEHVPTDASPLEIGRHGVVGLLHSFIRHREMLTVIAHQALSDPHIRALHQDVHERPTRRHARFLARLEEQGRASLAVPAPVLAEMVTGMVMRLADLAALDPERLPDITDQLVAAYARLTGLAVA